jgi:cyclopropane fatty-acyl-phospholipid synthase-like methyltransferase
VSSSSALPFSQASENNKRPIIEVLRPHLSDACSVLEIGSGTAQHGEYFLEQIPGLHWNCSDIPSNLSITNQRISALGLTNLPEAIPLDVNESNWRCGFHDRVFTANSLHIMSADSVSNFFRGLHQCLSKGGMLFLYGPFKYGGDFTTESNARFDEWLRQRDPQSGIRDFEAIKKLATEAGLTFQEDKPMPANNQLLLFTML